MATFTPPAVPAHFFGQALALPATTASPLVLPPSDMSSVTPSLFSDLSSLTGLLLSTQASQSLKKPSDGRDAILNPSPDKELDASLAGHKIKSICKPPYPVNHAGKEMCIAYHAKGCCYTLCNRAADHKR